MTLKVLSRIRHDGVVYEPGDMLNDVSDTQAKDLLTARVVEEVKAEPAALPPAAPQEPAPQLPPQENALPPAGTGQFPAGQPANQYGQNNYPGQPNPEEIANDPQLG